MFVRVLQGGFIRQFGGELAEQGELIWAVYYEIQRKIQINTNIKEELNYLSHLTTKTLAFLNSPSGKSSINLSQTVK